jgi:hypothetical protein
LIPTRRILHDFTSASFRGPQPDTLIQIINGNLHVILIQAGVLLGVRVRRLYNVMVLVPDAEHLYLQFSSRSGRCEHVSIWISIHKSFIFSDFKFISDLRAAVSACNILLLVL